MSTVKKSDNNASKKVEKNLDIENLNVLFENLKKEHKTENLSKKKFSLYREKQTSSSRKSIRKKRDILIYDIINAKNHIERLEIIKEFDEFYKRTYSLNDYSVLSLCSENTDKETKKMLKSVLELISKIKSL